MISCKDILDEEVGDEKILKSFESGSSSHSTTSLRSSVGSTFYKQDQVKYPTPDKYMIDRSSEYDQDSFRSVSIAYSYDDEEQDEILIPDEASQSPLPVCHKQQINRIPRPPSHQRAFIFEDIKPNKLPPITGHVQSQARVYPDTFQEKLPNYNKVPGSVSNKATPSYVRKTSQVVLPSLQKTRSKQQRSLNEVSHHQDFQQTTVITQEISVKNSIRCNQELELPIVPQPPLKASNSKIASIGSKILKLPSIQ